MSTPTVTNTFTNGTTIDAGQVNQNFSDVLAALTDGSKDLTIDSLTLNVLTVATQILTPLIKSASNNIFVTINADGTGVIGTALKLPTTGGTATALNYYEEGTFSATFSGGAGVGFFWKYGYS